MEDDLKTQVEGRLNELFGNDEEPMERVGQGGDHPLKDLKVRLLSIEWEITDRSMDSLLSELKRLEDLYKGDQIILTFLRLLGPIAKYIKVRKGASHPQATSVLNAIYQGLERVALSEDMRIKDKEMILLQEVGKFRKLKEEVIRMREKKRQEAMESARASRNDSKAVSGKMLEPESAKMPSHDVLARALEEIKEVIRAEFQALRDDMKRWSESR